MSHWGRTSWGWGGRRDAVAAAGVVSAQLLQNCIDEGVPRYCAQLAAGVDKNKIEQLMAISLPPHARSGVV